MRLTILGRYGPFPATDGATSGYLLEEKRTSILMDCGAGVISRLTRHAGLNDLNAVVLSHLHDDHISDMGVLGYALSQYRAKGLLPYDALPVYCPATPASVVERLADIPAFDIRLIEAGMQLPIGDLIFSFKEMTHPVECCGMLVTDGKNRLFYTGDTNMNDRLADIIYGVDYFLADAGLLARDKQPGSPHLSAREVGWLAKEACVRHVTLTHLSPFYDENEVAIEGKEFFDKAEVARERSIYQFD